MGAAVFSTVPFLDLFILGVSMHCKERGFFEGEESHVFSCDQDRCTADYEDTGEFLEVWQAAKNEGWVSKKLSDGLQHFCPDHNRPH